MSEFDLEEAEARYVSRPLSRINEFSPLRGATYYPNNPKYYPRVPTPLIQEVHDYELERLREETEMSEKLSETLSPNSRRKRNESQDL
jgi:hypothetical protein